MASAIEDVDRNTSSSTPDMHYPVDAIYVGLKKATGQISNNRESKYPNTSSISFGIQDNIHLRMILNENPSQSGTIANNIENDDMIKADMIDEIA